MNWTSCLNGNPDIVIKSCTAVIADQTANQIANLGYTAAERAIAFNHRGIAYIRKGSYNLAILDFDQAIRIKQDDSEALNNRGIAYANNGDYDSAIADFTKSILLNPRNALALYARGIAKQNIRDAAGAEADKTAAREIDPEVAGKVMNLMAPAHAVEAHETKAHEKSLSVPDCAVPPDSSPGSGSPAHGASLRTYVDDSVDELKKAAPALRGVKFDEGLSTGDSVTAAPARGLTASIVDKTSVVTAEMLSRIPNLIAREEVQQAMVSTLERGLSAPMGRRQQFTQSLTDTQYRINIYNYRIVPKKDARLDDALDEFRTDRHDHPIAAGDKDPDSPRSSGFATSWLFFVSGNIPESRFRYLGEQKIGNRETYVVAFAQIPRRAHMETFLQTPTGGCATYSQGLAWIDESTYRIVRMQTDLLYPIAQVDRVRSVLNYGEVKIQKLNLTLWLPSDVETTWAFGDRSGDEIHKYSNYRLFASTVTILPAEQTSSQ